MSKVNSSAFEREVIMGIALELARLASKNDCVPIGALVLSSDGVVIGKGCNGESALDHAEIVAINDAFEYFASSGLKPDKLRECTLFTTLEPCIMCAGAIMNAQIETVVFGAWDEKFGASGSVWDLLRDPLSPHKPEVFGGVLAEECGELLQNFFAKLR